MKVLLVNPPIENMISTNIPKFVDEERGYNPPLGLMYVAAYAERNTEHRIEILDALAEGCDYDGIEREIRRRSPDIVGITATTFTLLDALAVARIVKDIDPGISVILGGPHVNAFPRETIRLRDVDLLVLGEGEKPFSEALEKLGDKNRLKTVPGLVFEHDGLIIDTGRQALIDDLDSLPFPARHLTNIELYTSLLAKRTHITTMITSRGCPYRCTFCNRPQLGKRFRARSPENVVNEFEDCVNLGIDEIIIYDDTFTVDRKRVLEICKLIQERRLDVSWDIRARVNNVDREMLVELEKAGCERIHYGVESASERLLGILKKDISIPQIETAFRLTKEAGIETLAYFMIGLPTETKDDILYTIDFCKRLEPDYVHFSILMPFPSTDIYRMGMDRGLYQRDLWKAFAENPTTDFIPPIWDESLSEDELFELLKYSYRAFYLRPSYIVRHMMKMRSLDELRKKAKAGFRILRK